MSTFSWEERKNIYFFLSDLTFLLLLISTGFQLSPFKLFIPFRPWFEQSHIVPKFTPTSVKCVIASYNNHVIIHFSNDGSLRPAVKAKIIAKKSCKKVKERLRTEAAFVSRGVQRRAMIQSQFTCHVRPSEDDICVKRHFDRENWTDRCW